MPDKPATQLLREFAEQMGRFGQKLDHLQTDVDRLEARLSEVMQLQRPLDKQASQTARDVERLEKRFDDLLTRRWELGKLIFAGVLGSCLTLGGQLALKAMDRLSGPTSPAVKR